MRVAAHADDLKGFAFRRVLRQTAIMTKEPDRSEYSAPNIHRLELATSSYLMAVGFIAQNTSRDPSYNKNNLLSYQIQDFIESAFALDYLVREGLLSVGKRELRFIIESSIKICHIQQKEYTLSIEEKLSNFERLLDSPNISCKNEIELSLMPSELRDVFKEETGRLYGATSKYIHMTVEQIQNRMQLVDNGRTVGCENQEDVSHFTSLAEKVLAISLTLLLHASPEYVSGDLFSGFDTCQFEWHFLQSKYLAAIDKRFDYKAERKCHLDRLNENRAKRELF